jgi:acyl carrier protein
VLSRLREASLVVRDNFSRLGFDSPQQIRLDTSFFTDLGADSLDVVEIVMELEEQFDVSIPEEEVATIRTVADAIRYIVRRRMQ